MYILFDMVFYIKIGLTEPGSNFYPFFLGPFKDVHSKKCFQVISKKVSVLTYFFNLMKLNRERLDSLLLTSTNCYFWKKLSLGET